jgi:hypothetical protein
MDWAHILAYITGTVDQELLLRNEYLVTENRILKAQIKGRLLLSDVEKATLSEIAHRLGRKALEDVANSARPDTILGWYRKLAARKFDCSKSRRYPGRPKIDGEIEQLVMRMARENSGWGYDRIVAPWRTRVTRYQIKLWVIFSSARVSLPRRNASVRQLGQTLHDRDTKYCQSFLHIIESGDVKPLRLPARSPNLNAFSERWVKSVKEECLSKLILFGESSLRHTLREYVAHYNAERNHQGKDNILLFPIAEKAINHGGGAIGCNERLGGLLKYYHLEAA